MAKFRKVEMEISRLSGYGQYLITADYKNKKIRVRTTDSEAFDYLNDDSNKTKHRDAKRHCYYQIVNEYNCL